MFLGGPVQLQSVNLNVDTPDDTAPRTKLVQVTTTFVASDLEAARMVELFERARQDPRGRFSQAWKDALDFGWVEGASNRD